jgi:RNA polymerase sigma factor (sigma-70 family)
MIRMGYNELEEQWRPLIHKFSAKYTIPGYDPEDLEQELRIVLHKADQLFDPNKGTKFITYLYTAFNARLSKLYRDLQGRQKNVPANMVSYIPDGYDFLYKEEPDYDDIDLFTGLSFPASQIGSMVLEGKETWVEWKAAGMTGEEIRTGLVELRSALKGGLR